MKASASLAKELRYAGLAALIGMAVVHGSSESVMAEIIMHNWEVRSDRDPTPPGAISDQLVFDGVTKDSIEPAAGGVEPVISFTLVGQSWLNQRNIRYFDSESSSDLLVLRNFGGNATITLQSDVDPTTGGFTIDLAQGVPIEDVTMVDNGTFFTASDVAASVPVPEPNSSSCSPSA